MKVTFRHEAPRFGNQSHVQFYDIDAGEFAVMIDTDRQERALAAGKSVDEVPARAPQEILDELWAQEESVAHEAHRGDRGPGKKRCVCGHGCKPRQGCRAPETFPWTLDRMLEEGRDPGDTSTIPEYVLIQEEKQSQLDADLVALCTAIEQLPPKSREVIDLLLADMSQADIARHLNVSRSRVSQLFSKARKSLCTAVEDARVNTSSRVGSGVKGSANGVDPTTTKGR